MKRLLFVLLLFAFKVNAATYYVSATGSDSNSGLTTSLAWQTIDRVNTATIVAGDQILFERGGTFYGSLTIDFSGTAVSPITFGAYGTGANPVITGLTTVTAWTDLGGNIWESTSAVSTLSTCNMVKINGVNTSMGREPDLNEASYGYYFFQASSNTYITSSNLTGTPDWTGAEAVIKRGNNFFARVRVTSQSTSTIYFDTFYTTFTNGYGFFFQDDVRTLDQQNEWYFNPTTKKLRIYSTTQPTNVEISTITSLVNNSGASTVAYGSYITYQNLDFTGSNENVHYNWAGWATKQNHVTYDSCNFYFTGQDAISCMIKYLTVTNCTFNDLNGCGVYGGGSDHLRVSNSTFENIGMEIGMPRQMGGANSALFIGGSVDMIVEYCTFNNMQYNAINIGGANDSVIIRNNVIGNYCMIHDDGGAIYGSQKALITKNIILPSGSTAWKGTPGTTNTLAVGIYLDNNSMNNEVSYNVVSGAAWSGILLHDASYNNVHHNIVYNSTLKQFYIHEEPSTGEITNNTINYNQFISKSATQVVAHYRNLSGVINFGTADYNYYARPIDDNITISSMTDMNFASWQTYSGQDVNSNKSPYTITSEDDLTLVYNAELTEQSVSIPFPAKELDGTEHYSTITLQPYTAAVLFKDLTIQPPVTPPTPVYGKYPTRNTRDGKIYNKYNLR